MEENIIQSYKSGKINAVEELLNSQGNSELTTLIDRYIAHGKENLAVFLRAILAGSIPRKDATSKRCLNIIKHLLSFVDSQEVSSQMNTELVGLLLFEVDSLPAWCLADLANNFVNRIKTGTVMTGKCLELFPKILSVLELQEMVSFGDNEMNGADYKSHILNNLCAGRWNANAVIHLATMLKDVNMSSEELGFVINKILCMLSEVDLQELPPVIYQLLLLSTKGHKKLVLDGVISFFIEKDAEQKRQVCDKRQEEVTELVPNEQLHHIEGTAILHITFAIKQDQELGREFIRFFKANQVFSLKKVLAPFNVALALSVGKIHSFEDQIFDLLKSAILRGFKDFEKQQESHWVKEMAPEVCDVSSLVLDTVKNSVVGWDHITQGLVQLGFSLMEANGPKLCFGKSVESIGKLSPSQRACKLGSRLLFDTFKTHDVVRSAIVEQLLNNIVMKAAHPVSHYIELLSLSIKSSAVMLMECIPKLRESFDYLTYLPVLTSEGLLKAIEPLLKSTFHLKDSLLLVLRKAMFSRQSEARHVAVNGYLMLLNNFKMLSGISASQPISQGSCSSQVLVDIHNTKVCDSQNEALSLEILGNLRRCLGQQADVRLVLYEGLFSVLSLNMQLANPVISLLFNQLQRYYNGMSEILPPIKLDMCVVVQNNQPFTTEPLSHLLSFLVHCYLKKIHYVCDSDDMASKDEDNNDDVCKELERVLASLADRMIKCELEDFELGKSADFSTASSIGVRNTIFALLVCGVYEALMEYEFLAHGFDVERCQQMLQLFNGFHKLSEILKEKPSTSGSVSSARNKKRTRQGKQNAPSATALTTSSSNFASILSLKFVTEVARALFSDNDPGHQEAIAVIATKLDFQLHVLSVVLNRLQQINQCGFCDGPEGREPEKLSRYCLVMGKIALKHYCDCLTSNTQATEGVKQMRSRSIVSSCLEAFHLVVSIFCKQFPNKLNQLLLAIDSKRMLSHPLLPSDGNQSLICKHVLNYQKLVETIFSSGDEDHTVKDVGILISVIRLLSQHYVSDVVEVMTLIEWLLKLCKEQKTDDLTVAKVIIDLLLQLYKRQSNSMLFARDLARDIHIGLGDIDQEVEISDGRSFAVLSGRTFPSILLLLLCHIEREIDDTEWVINRLKAGSEFCEKSVNSGTQQNSTDKNICIRLGHLINIFHELLQTALPSGQCAELLVKAVGHFYAVLTTLVKWNLSMYSHKDGYISTRFEKLVKLSGTNLTQYVYLMITYLQNNQTDQMQAKSSTRKKKGSKGCLNPCGKTASLLRETRSIPNLIYDIEQYEKFLIQLSKKSKIDLMSHFKMSTSRDFRINASILQTALEKNAEESDSEQKESGGESDEQDDACNSENDDQPPPSKTAKVTKPILKTRKIKLAKK